MNPTSMRQMIVSGCDKVLQEPLLLRWVSPENRQLLQAERDFWQQADDPTVQKLIDIYNKEPQS